MNETISTEEFKREYPNINLPPSDHRCEACGNISKNKTLSLVKNVWCCCYCGLKEE